VRAVAVAPRARRAGLGRRLLAYAEDAAAERGVRAAYLFAWLPAGRPEPAALRLYAAAGYTAGRDLPDFYAAGSVVSGAHCPYCGAPPCRCAARPYVKRLGAA
jgi:ribosomal protein S18 acetylase RimI-like enzyme